ncbi:Fimbrial assembly family protein [Deinococcus proteolyticus MRP]|uniref:Fimbrial assembly family protein n=1 Tax=Deinococcus proteolyticus (strain ATCC 35074 / DSM 20540 / JCM 6276 / NBRC 101906 / NCIMB 13154 / VKM Ac-1939 / CCM 2703 / MRP) TaxID=693977 RepID=F0RLE5_DEIPM|nr:MULTISPECIES: fimbrial assembly protein [Deinococcus]ADY25849.1 Fimbrial assembly family protein [Deinococcus proteolyticus MRP]MCY1701971.1 fimbrial assembly protein [Deinococcus sp. SL84]
MVEVNLLPASQRRQGSGEGQGWLIAAAVTGLLSLATVAGMELYYASQVSGLRTDLERLNGEIAALQPAKTEFDKLQTEKTELEQVTNVARTLRDGKSYWSNDLAAFTAQLPAGGSVALDSLDMHTATQQSADMQQSGVEGGSVSREFTLTGTATTAQAVVDLLNAFESNPKFGIVFQGMQRKEPDNEASPYTFSASVGVAGAAPSTAGGTAPAGGGSAAAPASGAAPAPAAPAPAAPAPAAATPAAPASGGQM